MGQLVTIPATYIDTLGSYLGVDLINPIPRELQKYAESVSTIASGLNKKSNRSDFISDIYLDDSELLKAYQLYYTTANLPKIFYPLNELNRSDFFHSFSQPKILDVGAGTGSMTLGFALWYAERFQTTPDFFAWDYSQKALDYFQKFFQGNAFPGKLTTKVQDLEHLPDDNRVFDMIIAGNILNELSEKSEENFLNLLEQNLKSDGYAILIEPALIETSRRLLNFRNTLIQKCFFVYAPCFTQKPCPALIKKTDWCHHVLAWERPKFIEMIDEMVGHIKKSLKFSYLIVSKNRAHLGDALFSKQDFSNQFRVVSERFDEKGRTRAFLCNDLGRVETTMNKRDKNSSNEAFSKTDRYDVLETKDVVEKKSGIQIGRETKVKKVNSHEENRV